MQRATVTVHLKCAKEWTFRIYGRSQLEVQDKICNFKMTFEYDTLDIEYTDILTEAGKKNFCRNKRQQQEQFEHMSKRFGRMRVVERPKCKPLDMAAVNRFLRID